MSADADGASRKAGDFHLRRAELTDLSAVYAICLKTGDAGGDATPLHDDPDMLGHLYVAPYVVLEPEHAFVLEGPDGAAGYVVGARASADFYARMEGEWLPPLRRRIADPGPDPALWRGSDAFRRKIHDFQPFYPERLRSFPSHGHIDLMPAAQGLGWGRRMLERLMAELAAAGSPGLHLGVARNNSRALGFYARLGLVEWPESREGSGIILVRALP